MDALSISPMGTLNVSSAADDWRGYALANFPLAPFELDGVVLASVEGFLQGIKFPPGDPARAAAFLAHSIAAKRRGEAAERRSVWWNGRTLEYGSSEHHRLLARGIRAKFNQNAGLRLALGASAGLTIIHDVGPESPTTSLPATVFCRILVELRDELLATGTIAPA